MEERTSSQNRYQSFGIPRLQHELESIQKDYLFK